MTDTRNVYLLLFFLLALPTVFYSLKKRSQYTDRKKRMGLLVLMSALLVLWGVLGFSFYRYTIGREVLIVAERGAVTLYLSGEGKTDPVQGLLSEGISDVVTVEGTKEGDWASFKGSDILLPEKMLTIGDSKWYPVVLQKPGGQRLLLALDIQEGVPKSKIARVHIYWPSEIGDMLNRITFFKVDTI